MDIGNNTKFSMVEVVEFVAYSRHMIEGGQMDNHEIIERVKEAMTFISYQTRRNFLVSGQDTKKIRRCSQSRSTTAFITKGQRPLFMG